MALIASPPEGARRPITVALAGDVMLGRGVNEVIPSRGYAYPWGDVLSLLQRADLLLINLECALTAETRRWHDGYKAFYFRAEPDVVETLRVGGVDFASLANNHAGDFGTSGFLETVAVLDRAGIAHAGAGADLISARAPARLAANDLRIAVVAFADYPEAWAASRETPGINYIPVSTEHETLRVVEHALAEARAGADLVIFSIHWGPNMRSHPTAAFQRFARWVVDSGADLFWGHSAHVVQGIEIWNGRPILYDTGDFVDDYAVDPELRNDLSALFLLRVDPPRVVGLDLEPVAIGDRCVTLARGRNRDWFAARITELCAEMGTQVVEIPGKTALSVRVAG